ncbi:MAG: ABC transporter substrate-binding protein [Anaerolineales bacterium]|nr:ABC transporter substrate-binding protein [Anaerolineales bacterium]
MKNLRWQLLIVMLALVAIGLLLIGQQPVLQEIVPVKPATGGVYSEAIIGAYGRLNPALDYYNPADRDIDRLLYSGLIRFDDYGLPQGDLAESWGISQDGKVYNFSIRSNAVWHDGEPVTSDDILYTVGVMLDESIPLPEDIKEIWQQVEVKKLDEKTLQFILPEPFAPFLDHLTFGILPSHLLGGAAPQDLIEAPFNLNPVGSGPYAFEGLTSTDGRVDSVVLSAFEDYFLGRPFIDQVVMRYYPDAPTALAAYQNGDVLGISEATLDILSAVLKEAELKLYTGREPYLSLVYLNLDDPALPFFQDAAVRRAMLLGLNRQWMVDRLLSGQAIVAHSPIFPGTWAYYEDVEKVEYDPEKAIALLKENGYTVPAEGDNVRAKDGVALAFDLVYPDDPRFTPLAEAIKRDWEKLGMAVNLKPAPYEELVQAYLVPRSYQAALVELNLARSPDPDPYPFWDQAQITGGQNYAQWNDRQASEYLERGRITVDVGERAKAYRNFQVRFAAELPALPLFYPVYSYAVDAQVQNVRIGSFFEASDRFNNFASWYLVTKRPVGGASEPTVTP